MADRRELRRAAVMLIPALLTLALCLTGIGSRQPWQDEHATWSASVRSFGAFAHLLEHKDMVLSPYYLVARAWFALFGDSISGLRVLSALAMSASAGLLTVLGARLYGRDAGFMAGLVFASIPSISRYGQEARPYALATLCAVLCTWLFVRAFSEEAPPGLGRCFAYAGSITALGAFHLVGLCLLAAHALDLLRVRSEPPFLALRCSRRHVQRFAVAAGAGLLPVAPLLLWGRAQSSQLTIVEVGFRELKGSIGHLIAPVPFGTLLVSLACVGVLKLHARRALLIAWALLPPLLLFVTYDILHVLRPRYVVFTLPAYCLLAAGGLVRLTATAARRALVRGTVASALFAFGVKGQLAVRAPTPVRNSDFRGAAAQVRRLAQAGDAVVFAGDHGTARHARRAFQYELRTGPSLRDVFMAQSAEELGDFRARECPDSAACLPQDAGRLWFVTNAPPSDLLHGVRRERAELLTRDFTVAWHWESHNLTLALLRRKAAAPAPRPARQEALGASEP